MTTGECVFLLGCCLNSPTVLDGLIEKTGKQGKLFDPQLLPGPSFMWQALVDCRAIAGAQPSLTMWVMEMRNRMEGNPLTKRHSVLVDLVSEAFKDTSGFREALARPYVEDALLGSAKMDIAATMLHVKDTTKFKELLHAAEVKTSTSSGSIRAVQPLVDLGKYLTNRPKSVLGVEYLDKASDNGMVPGSMVGVVGPSGGGKTIVATNVISASIKHRRHAVLFQWEQSLEGDIMERICCNVTGYPLSVFRGKSEEALPKQVRDKLDKAKAVMGPYLHAFSFADNEQGAVGTLAQVKEACSTLPIDQDTGVKAVPFAKLFDWLGAMIEQAGVDKADTKSYQEIGNKLLLDISQWGKREKDLSFVFHQSDTAAQGAGPNHKPTKNQVYGIKSFAQRMDYMFSLGNMNKENKVAWFVTNKARHNQATDFLVRMVAEEMKFVDATDEYMTDHMNKFVLRGSELLENEQMAGNLQEAEDAYGGE